MTSPVSPTPKDTEAERREARWIEALSHRLLRSGPHWPQRLNFIRACMEMADAEIAAVLAAPPAVTEEDDAWCLETACTADGWHRHKDGGRYYTPPASPAVTAAEDETCGCGHVEAKHSPVSGICMAADSESDHGFCACSLYAAPAVTAVPAEED